MRVWLSVTGLVDEVSVWVRSPAGSVLEPAAAELLQSAAQREWPTLVKQQGGPSIGLHIQHCFNLGRYYLEKNILTNMSFYRLEVVSDVLLSVELPDVSLNEGMR